MNPFLPAPIIRTLAGIAGVAAVLAASGVAAADGPGVRPNVVVLLADDSGWGDYGLSGNANLRTPNIDSIGRRGAVLDRFYVCAVCSPTRAEFLTGRYHSRGGVRGVSTGLERLNLDEKTIADTFKAAGYATGAFGKWHNGSQWPYHPNARGFDEYHGFTSGHWGEYFDPPLEANGKPVRGRGYIADDFTDRALEFIERNRARPFLCYVPYNTPHSPFCVPDEYWNRFRDAPVAMRGRDGAQEDLAVTRCALAMMENLDDNVGRVLRRIDELGLGERTIVIYFSDNGPNSSRWNGDMKGRKGSTDEGGVRSLCCIRWPGRIREGTVIREIAGAMDLLPTLAALAGVARAGDKPLDGRDLSPLLLGTAGDWPERMIFSHHNGGVSVRTQRYRLDAAGALFDMAVDPGQTSDIAGREPEVARRLGEAVAAWRLEVLGAAGPVAVAGKPRGKRAAVVDPRPYPVGYREFPVTPLPARDGVPHGGVARSANAPNCSYFVNWTRMEDRITWDIEVETTGQYEVVIDYTCPPADAGARIEVGFKDSRLSGRVTSGWDPPLMNAQDRVPRRGESYMKEFRALPLGTMRLERGRGTLSLRALEIPGRSVMEVRRVTLKLMP